MSQKKNRRFHSEDRTHDLKVYALRKLTTLSLYTYWFHIQNFEIEYKPSFFKSPFPRPGAERKGDRNEKGVIPSYVLISVFRSLDI